MTTWRKELELAFQEHDDNFENVIDFAPKGDEWLNYYFDDYSKTIEGSSFTIWTKKRVYFPILVDGIESVGSVARYPDEKAINHIGS
jgi:hypothetical protein